VCAPPASPRVKGSPSARPLAALARQTLDTLPGGGRVHLAGCSTGGQGEWPQFLEAVRPEETAPPLRAGDNFASIIDQVPAPPGPRMPLLILGRIGRMSGSYGNGYGLARR